MMKSWVLALLILGSSASGLFADSDPAPLVLEVDCDAGGDLAAVIRQAVHLSSLEGPSCVVAEAPAGRVVGDGGGTLSAPTCKTEGPVVIDIRGTCRGHFTVDSGSITLRGAAEGTTLVGDGDETPGQCDDFYPVTLCTSGGADVRLEDLTVRGVDPVGECPRGNLFDFGLVAITSAGEIIDQWKLDADLIVLSACDTGLGRNILGEGAVSFAYPFLHAGARGLIVSQWKVDDRATALMMKRFYEIWARDGATQPPAIALKEARTWLRNYEENGERPYSHPAYWAAFVLIGEGF